MQLDGLERFRMHHQKHTENMFTTITFSNGQFDSIAVKIWKFLDLIQNHKVITFVQGITLLKSLKLL